MSVTIVAACVMIRGSWNPAHNSLSREHSERAALESVLTSKRKLFALFLEAVQRMAILFGGGKELGRPLPSLKILPGAVHFTYHPHETNGKRKMGKLCLYSQPLYKWLSLQNRSVVFWKLAGASLYLRPPDRQAIQVMAAGLTLVYTTPQPPLLSIRLIIPYTTPDLYFVVKTLCSLFLHSIPHTNHRPLQPHLVD